MESPNKTESQSPEEREAKSSEDALSEATSEKTVSDLEDREELSDSSSASTSTGTSVPSPDGNLNPTGSGGRADGSDTSGPM